MWKVLKFLRMLCKNQGLKTAHVYLEGHGDLVSRLIIRIARYRGYRGY